MEWKQWSNRMGTLAVLLALGTAALAAAPAAPLTEATPPQIHEEIGTPLGERAPGDAVDLAAALAAGADYLQFMAADITDDNAGNGTDGVDETPDDPDDGGWDWMLTTPPDPFHHSTAASPKNIYGATAQGLYHAYLATGDAGYFTAMTDAAVVMAGDADIRSAADLVFLMNYDDLPAVGGTTYQDAARTKYDARITTYGSATALAEYIRDARAGQGYENGIIAWDVGAWAQVAAMLAARYPGNGYDADADDIAEVLWQDSFNDSPGYFDVVDDAGWDPTYTDKNFWWYNLGITGLMVAFQSADAHTGELAGLATTLLEGQFSTGAVSFSYGANPDDEDWQSTAYAALALAAVDLSGYQLEISRMAYWTAATQDPSGGWIYSSGTHYPEIGGENTAALAFGTAPGDVLVDDDFTSQADVDVYNAANSTSYVFGYDAFGSLLDGIDAVSGSTIHLEGGTYVESGQIVIDEDLTILGDPGDKPVIMTDSDTGTSGDARGWWLLTAGNHLELHDCVLDGAGHLIYQGIRAFGTGVLADCELRNMAYQASGSPYAGTGIVAVEANWTVDGCTLSNIGRQGIFGFGTGVTAMVISDCVYTGKGDGDWLDYGIELGGGAVADVDGCTITACTGVASSDGSTSAGILATTYYGAGTAATIDGCTLTGNTVGVAVGYDGSDTAYVEAHGNDISGNTDHGMVVTGTVVCDALGNWWGHASGPYHPTLNPLGTGNEVSDNVLFDPWSGMGGVGLTPAASGPVNCSTPVTLDFDFTPDAMTPAMRGYHVRLTAGAEVSFDANDVTVYTLPAGATPTIQVMDNGTNDVTIDYAILGPTAGITGAQTLFSVEFQPVTDGTAAVSPVEVILRDLVNEDIGADVGADATILADCTAPGVVTGITAEPGHEKVTVSWSDPGVVDFTGVEIWRGLWHDGAGNSVYPEYDDVVGNTIPTRPGSRAAALASAEWELAGSVAPGAESFVDALVPRGVYYYEVFTVDAAVNYGPAAASNDRATNYWLGDVHAYDGDVDLGGDITVLGASYGESEGDPDYNNECDVGPCDVPDGKGIPDTDNEVAFEDLMIFSLNYGTVFPRQPAAEGSETARLAWERVEDRIWSLTLVEPCADLRGLNLRAAIAEGVGVTVSSGALLDEQAAPAFLENAGGLDLGLAVLGEDARIVGAGELLRVVLTDEQDLSDAAIDARSSGNEPVEVEILATGAPQLPGAYRFAGNYPNPFNPKTSIRFDLPRAESVRLVVFGPDGRRVATLVNETLPAGYHSVEWNGRDDRGEAVASGVYFSRIEAGPLKETRKMLLLK